MDKNSKVAPFFTDRNHVIAASIAVISILFSYSVSAQMRPECIADPSQPGACFFTAPAGEVFFFCPDGAVVLGTAEEAKREIGRVNPNGTIAVHQTAGLVPAGACRTEDFPICGTTQDPGPGVFLGYASFQANGFITQEGNASCPLKSMIKGTLFRDVGYGPEEVEVDAVLHLVKDDEGGCRLQQCRIFAPADGE